MNSALLAALVPVSIVLVYAAGFVSGSRWCATKVRASIDKCNEGLDALGLDVMDAPNGVGGASARWTPADPADDDTYVDGAWTKRDALELAALTEYQTGLVAWDQAAIDRLMDAVRNTPPPTCESCEVRTARYIVLWDGKAEEVDAGFFVCDLCLSVVVVEPGVKIEELRP